MYALLQQYRSVSVPWSTFTILKVLFTRCSRGVAGADGAELARRLAQAWLANVRACWQRTGMMAEKHSALRPGLAGGGGEYAVQASQSLTPRLLILHQRLVQIPGGVLVFVACRILNSLFEQLTLLLLWFALNKSISQVRMHVLCKSPSVADADGFWVDKRRGALPAGPVWLEPRRGSL